MSYFPPKRDFQSLSVRDLLEAREAYHAHLVVKQNVIATAIGRYFIRITDPDSAAPGREIARGVGEARTLLNSAVQPWSWPCVLVFVRHWQPQGEFARHPSEAVPPFLYLADGRVAPVCVVEAPQGQPPRSRLDRLTFPSELLGGGYPVLTDVQGEQHIGSIGCLVSDGDRTYAVTNRPRHRGCREGDLLYRRRPQATDRRERGPGHWSAAVRDGVPRLAGLARLGKPRRGAHRARRRQPVVRTGLRCRRARCPRGHAHAHRVPGPHSLPGPGIWRGVGAARRPDPCTLLSVRVRGRRGPRGRSRHRTIRHEEAGPDPPW